MPATAATNILLYDHVRLALIPTTQPFALLDAFLAAAPPLDYRTLLRASRAWLVGKKPGHLCVIRTYRILCANRMTYVLSETGTDTVLCIRATGCAHRALRPCKQTISADGRHPWVLLPATKLRMYCVMSPPAALRPSSICCILARVDASIAGCLLLNCASR